MAGYTELFAGALLGCLVGYLLQKVHLLQSDLDALTANQSDLQGQEQFFAKCTLNDFKHKSLKFAMVSDQDHASKDAERFSWKALARFGVLTYEAAGKTDVAADCCWRIDWQSVKSVKSALAAKNRGMELSELIQFNGKMYAICDGSGIIFEVDLKSGRAYQRIALADGNGFSVKPFKGEWATVKDGRLLVGSMGREWVNDDGSIEHFNPQFVKSISPDGQVKSVNWRHNYEALRTVTNTTLPGYLWHEAVEWDPCSQRWIILPRKASQTEPYTPESDETRGTNILLTASEDFTNIQVFHLGPLEPEWGFSSVRRVPNSNGVFVALKTYEVKGTTKTKITVFDFLGPSGFPRLLLKSKFLPVGDETDRFVKYEGLEFLPDSRSSERR